VVARRSDGQGGNAARGTPARPANGAQLASLSVVAIIILSVGVALLPRAMKDGNVVSLFVMSCAPPAQRDAALHGRPVGFEADQLELAREVVPVGVCPSSAARCVDPRREELAREPRPDFCLGPDFRW
jgi:hypothetical protein